MKNLIFTISLIAAIVSTTNTFAQTAPAATPGTATPTAAPATATPAPTTPVVTTPHTPELELASMKGDFNLGLGVAFIEEGLNPAGLFVEYAFAQNFSAGLHFSYASIDIESDISLRIFQTELRASYHFGELMSLGSHFDLYAGLGATYAKASVHSSYSGDSIELESENDFGAHIGARVYLGKTFGLFAEATHISESYMQLGLTVKF